VPVRRRQISFVLCAGTEMNAYRSVSVRPSPVVPTWHPPAEQLAVIYPQPSYGRRKDASLYGGGVYAPQQYMRAGEFGGQYGPSGSFAYAPGYEMFGADVVPAAQAAVQAVTSEKAPKVPKPIVKQLNELFKKDESGVSKGGQIAKKGLALLGKPKEAAAPPPAPVVIMPQAAQGTPMLQVALVGLTALGVGFGIGYMVGNK